MTALAEQPSSLLQKSETEKKPRLPVWRVGLFLVLAWALLAGLPYVRGLPPLAGTLLATVLFLWLFLYVIFDSARFPPRLWIDGLGLAGGLILWHLAGLASSAYPPWRPFLAATASVAFIIACMCFGRLLSLIIRERNLLLPVALIAGLADIFTVFFGPTGQALQKAPQIVQKLSVAIPKVGSASGVAGGAGVQAIATAGLGDFIFLAFFFVSVHRFGLRARRTFWLIFIFALAGMFAVLFLPDFPAAPLLPFIVAGFLIANWREFRLTPQERRYLAIALSCFLALFILLGWLWRAASH